jgi:hypothetical protein
MSGRDLSREIRESGRARQVGKGQESPALFISGRVAISTKVAVSVAAPAFSCGSFACAAALASSIANCIAAPDRKDNFMRDGKYWYDSNSLYVRL